MKRDENERDTAIADLAHDFNNVLAGIKASAQYLLKFVLPDPEGLDAAALTEHLSLIESSVGKGAGILNRFVASTLGQDESRTMEGPAATRPTAQRPRCPGKALVVDQDRMLRAAVAKSLELSGWEVVQAVNATGSSGADLVIMDPRGRTAEALRQIRDAAPGAAIILTPSRAEEPGADPFALGAARILNKPFARDELERAVRAIGR